LFQGHLLNYFRYLYPEFQLRLQSWKVPQLLLPWSPRISSRFEKIFRLSLEFRIPSRVTRW